MLDLALLEVEVGEFRFLDERRRASQGFYMLARHLNRNNIDAQLTEAVDEDDLYLDRARHGEDMHLEHLLQLKVEVGQLDWHFGRL